VKTTVPIALLFISTISSYGQKIRFTDTSNVWTTVLTKPDHVYYVLFQDFRYSKDTFFEGFTYHQLGGYYIREDTTANKVFLRYASANDTSEHLLYNYNLRVSDTVYYDTAKDLANKYWVYQIDSTQINGIWYKVWHFEGNPLNNPSPLTLYHYNIIESIGCTNGLDFPLAPSLESMSCTQFTCFKNNGSSYPLSDPVAAWYIWERSALQFDNATSCTLAASNLSINTKPLSVFPNPIDATSKIIFPNNIRDGKLIICNTVGQMVININFKDKEEFLIGNAVYSPGIYFYHVSDNQSGVAYTGKFIYR